MTVPRQSPEIADTYQQSQPQWEAPPKAPADAPNVLIIILDDVGYSDLGCYGSEIATPHIDSLAAQGVRYSNFHVTPMCSPTRAALLTGRNSHSVGVGSIAEWYNGFPAYVGRVNTDATMIQEVLKAHHFGTYMAGKWHLTNVADYGAAGPHDDWPLARGFSRWYGFHGGLTDQWNPELYCDNRPLNVTTGPDYHLSGDLVDHTIADIRDHITSAPDRPFFSYLALGAAHWPHHVPMDYIRRQSGRYDMGWDEIRRRRHARQLELGLLPAGTRLAPRNPGVPAWEELDANTRQLSCRLQETYAAFLEHTDDEIGRLLKKLEEFGELDRTLVILMSDNGASAEGGLTGAINIRKHMKYEAEVPAEAVHRLDEIGGPDSYPHYSEGWAQVSNTPCKLYKMNAYGGGVRAPLIIRGPVDMQDAGTVRHQYHHVTDIAPTIYELTHVSAPQTYRGVAQRPLHGVSMVYTFAAPAAPTRKEIQYHELCGDRALWQAGWKVVAKHRAGTDFDNDPWELYHLDRDFSEMNDLAAQEPQRLREMVALWWQEARKYGVLPLDDRKFERGALQFKLMSRSHYAYRGGMARIDRLLCPDVTGCDFRLQARFESNGGPVDGVLLSWGNRFAGMVLYLKDGQLHFEYVFSEKLSYALSCPLLLGAGAHSVDLDFTWTGPSSAHATVRSNGDELGMLEIPRTWPGYGQTAGIYCGENAGSPVSKNYVRPFAFTGQALAVTIDLALPTCESDPQGLNDTIFQEA